MEQNKKKLNERWCHDYKVFYEDDAASGAEFLGYYAPREEAMPLFSDARSQSRGMEFQDRNQKKYLLKYNYATGEYTIEKKLF